MRGLVADGSQRPRSKVPERRCRRLCSPGLGVIRNLWQRAARCGGVLGAREPKWSASSSESSIQGWHVRRAGWLHHVFRRRQHLRNREIRLIREGNWWKSLGNAGYLLGSVGCARIGRYSAIILCFARPSGPYRRGAGNGTVVLTTKNIPLIIFKLRHHGRSHDLHGVERRLAPSSSSTFPQLIHRVIHRLVPAHLNSAR
jgi:hypothetical protein